MPIMNNKAPTINLDVLWSDGTSGADEAKRNITAKKKRTATAMAPNTAMIFTITCVIEAYNLTLRLEKKTYSDSRNNLNHETRLISKNQVHTVRCMTMAKRSKQTKHTSKSIKLTPSKKHLSSEDFLKKADKLWRSGPSVRYKDPDAWQRALN